MINYRSLSSNAIYSAWYGRTVSKTESFVSTAGSHISKVVIQYRRDDQLRILVNNSEIMRSYSDLYCGVDYCGQSSSVTYTKTINTNLFIDGTNTITFVNYNIKDEFDGDHMFYYATLTFYYK